MKIANVRKIKKQNKIVITADIHFNDGRVERPYFSLDERFETYIAQDASSFLAAFLIPCMQRQENIIIDGSVSRKFFDNVHNVIDILVGWDIGLHRIDIAPKSLTRDAYKPQHVATFFSAGVDSFYTYLKNKKSRKEKITHFLFVHGFDIELENTSLFRVALKNIKQIADEENITLISLKTNIKSIIEKDLVWDFGHGGALGAVALLLRRRFKQIYIAGSVSRDTVFTYGTHPDLDPLWSAEKLSVIHDGTEYNRVDKITELVGKSDLALSYLRVCSVNTKGTYNCGKCFKCLRTMIELLCVTTLDKARTFPDKIDLKKVRNMYYDYSLFYELEGYAVLHKLKAQNKYPRLQRAILRSLLKSRTPGTVRKAVMFFSKIDRTYNRRRLYRFVFKMNQQKDRSLLFKTLFRMGVIK